MRVSAVQPFESCLSQWNSTLFSQAGRSLAPGFEATQIRRARESVGLAGSFGLLICSIRRWLPTSLISESGSEVGRCLPRPTQRFQPVDSWASPSIRSWSNLKDAAAWLPCSTLLACEEPTQRIAEAEEFMRQHGLQFPVVLKPDAGQRGSGVSIVRSSGKLCEYLTHAAFPVILQEYVPGEEYGVFYYPLPR